LGEGVRASWGWFLGWGVCRLGREGGRGCEAGDRTDEADGVLAEGVLACEDFEVAPWIREEVVLEAEGREECRCDEVPLIRGEDTSEADIIGDDELRQTVK
jgi:hypothetical protein